MVVGRRSLGAHWILKLTLRQTSSLRSGSDDPLPRAGCHLSVLL